MCTAVDYRAIYLSRPVCYHFDNSAGPIFVSKIFERMFRWILTLIGGILLCTQLQAQDTLPNFSLNDLGQNRVRIAWVNPYENCIQLNIQRSSDSVRNFRTIFSAQSPQLPQNGYIDNKIGGSNMYYRIFYVLQGGGYFFSKSQRIGQGFATNPIAPTGNAEQMIRIKVADSVIATITYEQYRRFRDSIIYQTKDSLFTVNDQEVVLKRFNPQTNPSAWQPSIYIFTNREGYVIMHLPDAKSKTYKVTFYDTDGKQLFKINHVKEPELILDKTDFLRSGWFSFDLHENDRLLEHNKFYIPKEF